MGAGLWLWKRIGLLADFAVFVLAWNSCVWVVTSWYQTHSFAMDWLSLAMILTPALNMVYLQVRVVPLISVASDRRRREELALTMVSAPERLTRLLRAPILRALAPMVTLLPVYLIVSGLNWSIFMAEGDGVGGPWLLVWSWETFIIGSSWAMLTVGLLLLSVAGVFQVMIWLCRRPSAGFSLLVLGPLGWHLLSFCFAVGFIVVALALLQVFGIESEAAMAACFVVGSCAFALTSWAILRERWRLACAAYYQFE